MTIRQLITALFFISVIACPILSLAMPDIQEWFAGWLLLVSIAMLFAYKPE